MSLKVVNENQHESSQNTMILLYLIMVQTERNIDHENYFSLSKYKSTKIFIFINLYTNLKFCYSIAPKPINIRWIRTMKNYE